MIPRTRSGQRKVVTTLGTKVDPDRDAITVDGKPIPGV